MAKLYYQATVKHEGLNKFRIIKAASKYELDEKVSAVQAQWAEQWQRKCEADRKRAEKEFQRRTAEEAIAYAEQLTQEAETNLLNISEIKLRLLNPIPLNSMDMKDFSVFPEEEPQKPYPIKIPNMPNRDTEKYNPKMPFFTRISKQKKAEFEENNRMSYQNDLEIWQKKKEEIEDRNAQNERNYQNDYSEWEKAKSLFEEEQRNANDEIDILFERFNRGEKDAIEFLYSYGLEQLDIPIEYKRGVFAEYNPETKALLLDILLPIKQNIPTLKKVTYVKSKNEYKEQHQSEAFIKSTYDKAIYDIVLVTLNYIFKLDVGNFINAVVLNGQVETIDEATGKEIAPYILSVNVTKESFAELNLTLVDSKAWFKSTKGVSAATFTTVTPVPPIVKMNREDRRFVEGYDVIENIDDSVNLAAIDWQDFENLIRELFAEEFSSTGGEVKVTQASRDGGVDAIAFDPDPIRGGKIVIQAKRYTNVVGVSAVRDLYGTVMNEGATKGILVTTSNYGNDAYEFAKGKPLTLLNGANLLALMEKHGHKARIDIKEARKILGL
ncbi:MAG: restriction endonuclease [Lachnospiraceae bacterium]|nr:restriction endonuclease [Lachnospiraceae bacterium]